MVYSQRYLADLRANVKGLLELLEQLREKKILITGASGLIGSALVDLLECANRELGTKAEVFAAGRNRPALEKRFGYWGTVSFVQYEAQKPLEGGREYDFIIHCASNAHPAAYGKEPVETMLSNFCGVNHLMEYVRAQESRGRVLFVSSSEVYGNRSDAASWYTEDHYFELDILNARACYPSSKRAAETLCRAYVQEYGADVVIARPGHVYGPTMTEQDSRASAQFFRDVLNGGDILMKSAGRQLRSYCYVMDCASAILTILLKGACGEAYNVSNRDSVVTIRRLADTIAAAAGKKVSYTDPTDQELRNYNMMQVSALDASKLEKLGWNGRYDIEAGVKTTLEILSAKE